MKKLICWLLTLAICFGLAACGAPAPAETTAPGTEPPATTTAPTEPAVEPDTELADAIAYLKNIYKEAAETTASDFQRVGTVMVGQNAYEVVWSADVEGVKFTKDEAGMITVDVIEDSETDIPYVLTATLTGTDGTVQTLSWNHVMPASLAGNTGKIIELAYALEDGQSLDTAVTLTGTISSVDTAWSEDYQNITVTIKVAGYEDYPIQCYRLKGEGAKDLAYGDVITVTGTIKNYKGIIEFDAGCSLDSLVKGTGEGPESPLDYTVIVAEAMELKPGQSLAYIATLTGRVESIDYGYSEKYGDISITIEVRGEDIYCYRLSSPRTDWLKQVGEGDWVTVMGKIKNYNGTIEFDSATMIAYTDYYRVEGPEDPLEHIDAAYALKPNKSLEYTSTLTGVITEIDTEWSDTYNNISVVIQVPGRADKPILCYRLTGEGAKDLAVGDTITVTGTLTKFLYDGDDESEAVVEFKAGCELSGEVVKGEGSEEPSEPVEPETPSTTLDYVTAPAAGTAYKLGLNQTKKESVYFFTGEMSGFYGATENNYNEAVDVYLEETAGGYYLYFTDDTGGKQYINLIKSGTYYNFTFGTEAVSVYTFDEEKDALCTDLEGEVCYMGTYGSYVTFGVLRTSKLSDTDYIGRLYTSSGTADTPSGDDITTEPTVPEETVPEEPFVKPTTAKEIVDAAYALEEGDTLAEGPYTLTGVISSVDYTYSEQYGNVTVTIIVDGMEEQPIQCFRMKGEGADKIGVGDTITVTGDLMNYGGTIEFDSGCKLDSYELAGGESTDPTVPEESVPEESTPEESTPEESTPEESTPEESTPEESTPEESTPEESTPEESTPEESTPEESTPEESTPEESTPEESTPEESTPEEIVNAAYALEAGEALEGTYTLTGVITEIDSAYSATYGNISVVIQVGDMADKPILCYRLEGDGADVIGLGDTITVTGTLKNYNGTVEFDKGCILGSYELALNTPERIVNAAYALEAGEALEGTYTLTGVITEIDSAYSATYGNISVVIQVGDMADKPILCYRLEGDGADVIGVGYTIAVTGTLKNYNSTIEFDKGCSLDSYAEPTLGELDPTDPSSVMDHAYALASGEALVDAEGNEIEFTLTGKVVHEDTLYDSGYGNLTVTLEVDGREIQAFRLSGTDADKVKLNDTITVKGTISNYQGTVQLEYPEMVEIVESSDFVRPVTSDEIIAAAADLGNYDTADYLVEVTGKIKSIDTPYSTSYKNITVTITLELSDGTTADVQCYRMKGTGISSMTEESVGTEITVSGYLAKYQGTLQMAQGCKCIAVAE